MKVGSRNISQSNSPDDENFSFKASLLKYLRYWPVFLCSILLAASAAFVLNQYTPPVYKIQSKFLIKEEPNPINLFDYNVLGSGVLPKGQKIANETVILKSRGVAESALDRLPFDVEYYREGLFINTELYKDIPITVEVDWNHTQLVNGPIKITWTDNKSYTIEFPDKEYQRYVPGEEKNIIIEKPGLHRANYAFGEWFQFSDARFRVTNTSATDNGTLIVKIRSRESLLQQYTGDKLQITPVDKTSSILLLTLDTNQPQKGRDYLDMIMRVFLDIELSEKNTVARNTVNFIDSQISGISDSLSRSENKLEKFRSRNRTYNITTEGNTMFEKLSELEKSLSQEKFKREYYQNLQEYLVREDYSGIVVPSGIGIEDPVLNKLIEDLIRFQAEKSRFLATQTESSPTVIEVNRKIKDLNNSIKEVLRNVNRNTDLLISDLEKRIAKFETQFGRLPQTEQDLLSIKRRYSLNESIYTFLLQRRAEASISLASNMPSNKIIEPAVLNFVPLRLKPLLNYLLAMLLGLIVPIIVISMVDMFSVKIKDIKEMEEKLAVPVVGHVGHNKNNISLVVFSNPRSVIAEAFRAIRMNFSFILLKDKQLTIMVTSSIAGEGKTFCAINLASVYSLGGKKTILVGCDMHKTSTFVDFQLPSANGLSNFLSGQVNELKNVIQRTKYPNLDVVMSGPVPPNPAELLISDRFEQMMHELKQRYDVIILDSSPLGLTNETLYLTRIADITIYMLRQKYSHKTFVDDINALKEKKGVKNLYVVVNDIERKYLSHKGYGYGYYAEDKKKQKTILKEVSNKAAL